MSRHILRFKFEAVLFIGVAMALMITSPTSAQTGILGTDLGKLYEGDRLSSANGINDWGQIVGASCTAGQLIGLADLLCTVSGEMHATLWAHGP